MQFHKSLLLVECVTSLLLISNFPTVAGAQSIAQLPASSGPATSVVGATIEDYVLGAGDILRVDVFRIPDYSGEYEVLVSGALNLPAVGQVSVAGLTLEQAEQAISQAYAQRLRRPLIDLLLVNPRPLNIGVVGEVSRPGAYTLQREGTQFPTLVDALETAAGITQSADLRQVIVQRPTESGSEQEIVTNLWRFLETGDLQYNITLRDGDTIIVPTRDTYDHRESLQLAAASFAADESRPLNIAVVGEVFRPGPYTVTGTARTGEAGVPGVGNSNTIPPTVTRAIQVAGGIKPEANIREIEVYRSTRNGKQQTINVNLWQLLTAGNLTEDIVLQEGDTVVVPKADALLPEELAEVAAASFSPDTIRINVVGEVDNPGVVEVTPDTPLSQGILAAGGFNNRARRRQVRLVRLNPDGTATQRSIEIDFTEGIDEASNPLLRNNDVIIVRRSTTARVGDTLGTVLDPLSRAISIFTLPERLFRLFD